MGGRHGGGQEAAGGGLWPSRFRASYGSCFQCSCPCHPASQPALGRASALSGTPLCRCWVAWPSRTGHARTRLPCSALRLCAGCAPCGVCAGTSTTLQGTGEAAAAEVNWARSAWQGSPQGTGLPPSRAGGGGGREGRIWRYTMAWRAQGAKGARVEGGRVGAGRGPDATRPPPPQPAAGRRPPLRLPHNHTHTHTTTHSLPGGGGHQPGDGLAEPSIQKCPILHQP